MRRIAALFGAISLLTACSSGDIVVKTDLDEQYIIKESAVTKIPFDWKKAKDDQNQDIEDWEGILKSSKDGYRKCLSYNFKDKDYCENLWSDLLKDNDKHVSESKAELKNLVDFEKKDKADEGVITTVRYRPVFKDINGDKNALGYATATCLNPKGIGSEDSEKLFEILGMSADDTEKKKTAKESAYLSVTKKVCDKHAFANAAFFNYTVDEDQDKDKKE